MQSDVVLRLFKIVTLLQAGKPASSEHLARALAVSRRTVFRDIQVLKNSGVPVLYDAASRSYVIERSFFLPAVNFTLPEVLGLMMVLQKLGPEMGLPDFESVAGAALKIESSLPPEIQQECGSALGQIEFRPGPISDARAASDTFPLLWQGATDREAISVRYDSYYEGAEIETRLHPYRLSFIGRSWYLIAYSQMHREVRTFKIERLTRVRLTGDRFEVAPSFDPATYFGQAWRMIPGDQRYQVRVRFAPKVAGNVEEVLWHPTQGTTRHDDGSMTFEVTVDGVEEIAWWILGYGKEAVVEEPPELRAIIRKHADEMADAYRDS